LNIVKDKAFSFAVNIIKLARLLSSEHLYEISGQIIRSGTSIGANIEEAEAGQTKKDFVTKMSIASKEARETHYWLRLLKESKVVNYNYDILLNDNDELIRLLTSIVKTTQQSLNTKH